MFKNLLDMTAVCLVWWLWGYGFASDGASRQSVGKGDAFGDFGLGSGVSQSGSARWGNVDWNNSASFFHSLTFAMTTTTIMSGGVCERMRLKVYLYLSVILSSLVYAPTINWAWGQDGWLRNKGENEEKKNA